MNSLGTVRGIGVLPTQMMVSLVQAHPEGHLKFLLAPDVTRKHASTNSIRCVSLVDVFMLVFCRGPQKDPEAEAESNG